MGGVEDNNLVDLMIDEIGSALTKVDQTIQKSIELWTELTKDLTVINLPKNKHTNNGEYCVEHSSQDMPIAKVKERPVQHWSMRLGSAKDERIHQWAMEAFKIRESLIQEEKDNGLDFNEEVEDDTTTSNEYNVSLFHIFIFACYMRQRGVVYELVKSNDTFSKKDEENETNVSESCENMSKLNLGDSATNYAPSVSLNQFYTLYFIYKTISKIVLRWKCGYELIKNDDDISLEEEEYKEIKEWMRKHGIMSDEDEDEDKFNGFVDVEEEEEIVKNKKVGEVDCDWVYV
ncbi:unnamed protein product [Cochlearia groenlandica]